MPASKIKASKATAVRKSPQAGATPTSVTPADNRPAGGQTLVERISIPDFAPAESLRNAFRFWWLLVLLVVAGGLVGGLFNRAHPPLYEAVAQYSAGIDYVSTGPLTQFEEDTAYNTLGDIINSKTVIANVLDRASANGQPLTATDLHGSFFLERRFNIYVLRVRNSDPARAEWIANTWLSEARLVVEESYGHALAATKLENDARALETCLLKSVASEIAYAPCQRASFADIQKDLQETGNALYNERLASRAWSAGLIPGQVDSAVVSAQPVAYQQNQMVLAGALIGLILAIAVLESGLPARWLKK